MNEKYQTKKGAEGNGNTLDEFVIPGMDFEILGGNEQNESEYDSSKIEMDDEKLERVKKAAERIKSRDIKLGFFEMFGA